MNHRADFIIHIDEELSDTQLDAIERDLIDTPGVYSACVNAKHRHLMLVDYDPDLTSSGLLHNRVRSHGVHSELAGL
ncbi:MAG: heavy-metal-associated domain-containing protein [Gammaproteobacteria bacterium]